MAGSGHGQEFSFAASAIANIRNVRFTGKGRIIEAVVADAAYPLTESVPGVAKWMVDFMMPATTPHTALSAIAAGETGAIEWNSVAGLKMTAATGKANGYDIGAASDGWVLVSAEFTASGAVTPAAAD